MKITRILPKNLAISYQEHDLRRTDAELAYHRGMACVLAERSAEGHAELERLKRESK